MERNIPFTDKNYNGKIVTVQPAPFEKTHCVLIVADATVLLIEWRSAHTDVRSQKHTSVVLCFPYTVWLNCYKKLKIKKTVHGKASDAPFFKLVKSDQASCNAVCKRRYFTSGSSREIHRLSEYTVADLHISFVIFSF